MSEALCVAIVALWDLKRFSTWDIAQILSLSESAVDRVVHIRREAARGVVA